MTAPLDPDPRYVPEDPRLPESWEHRRSKVVQPTYSRELEEARSCLLLCLGLLAIVVLVVAVLVAPRSAPDPTAPSPASDVAGLALASTVSAASASDREPSGAPHGIRELTRLVPGVRRSSDAPSSPAVDDAGGRHTPAGVFATGLVVSGPATWYDAPTIRDAAAGPALRKALGPHWRGSTVRVCASSCVVVQLTDWCACHHGRVIDLDDAAFRRLAPLSVGVIRVTVEVVGQIDVPSTDGPTPTGPATDVE